LVNSIYEANLGETKKIAPEAELATRKEFIRNKYKDKKFVVPFDHAAHDIQRVSFAALLDQLSIKGNADSSIPFNYLLMAYSIFRILSTHLRMSITSRFC
jgi:hypothetical protein